MNSDFLLEALKGNKLISKIVYPFVEQTAIFTLLGAAVTSLTHILLLKQKTPAEVNEIIFKIKEICGVEDLPSMSADVNILGFEDQKLKDDEPLNEEERKILLEAILKKLK